MGQTAAAILPHRSGLCDIIYFRMAETVTNFRLPLTVSMVDVGVKSEVSFHNKICSCGFAALTISTHRFFSRPFDHEIHDYVMVWD